MQTLVMDGVRGRLDLQGSAAATPAAAEFGSPVAPTTPKRVRPAPMDGLRPRPLPTVSNAPLVAAEARKWDPAPTLKRFAIPTAVAAMAVLVSVGTQAYLGSRAADADTTANATAQSSVTSSQSDQPSAPATDSAALQKLVSDFAGSAGAPFGVVVKNLQTGQTASVNADQVFTSASLYKLFVAETIYKRIDSGELTLGARVPGNTDNVGQCLDAMITLSDNDCGAALGTMVGWGSQDSALKNLGFKSTSLAEPQRTSAGDVATLLERLYAGMLLSPNSSQQFIGLLKAQRVNNRLPAGLPSGTVVAHKTGDLYGFVHDAGIVYSPKGNYVISVTSGPWSGVAAAPQKISDLSRRVYDLFNQ